MTEPSGVISFNGARVAGDRTPDKEVVALLEDITERARNGNVYGVFAVTIHDDGDVTWHRSGASECRVIGALDCLKAELVEMQIHSDNWPEVGQ